MVGGEEKKIRTYSYDGQTDKELYIILKHIGQWMDKR
jgi:hypothetical protein